MARRSILPVILAALMLAACGPAGAGNGPPATATRHTVLLSRQSEAGLVRLSETIVQRSYTVSGSTAAELRRSLDAAAPRAQAGAASGGAFDGSTDWQVRWSFRYDRKPGACSLESAEVSISITIVLPEHASPEALPAELLAEWQPFTEALAGHELGHAERQLGIVRELAGAFDGTAPAADCAALAVYLNATGESHLERIRRADAAYDLETGHGATQGAVFP